MDKFVGGLKSDGYECTCDILGYGSDEVQSLELLGRQIHLKEEGIEWEGDSRHAEAYLTKLAAAFSSGPVEVTSGMRAVHTPGVKRPDEEWAENGVEQQLNKEQHWRISWRKTGRISGSLLRRCRRLWRIRAREMCRN